MFKKIFDRIEKADVITIFGHVFPDGDCYGSSQGLKALLEECDQLGQLLILQVPFI